MNSVTSDGIILRVDISLKDFYLGFRCTDIDIVPVKSVINLYVNCQQEGDILFYITFMFDKVEIIVQCYTSI